MNLYLSYNRIRHVHIARRKGKSSPNFTRGKVKTIRNFGGWGKTKEKKRNDEKGARKGN